MTPNTPKDNNHNNDLSYSKKDAENRIVDNVELDEILRPIKVLTYPADGTFQYIKHQILDWHSKQVAKAELKAIREERLANAKFYRKKLDPILNLIKIDKAYKNRLRPFTEQVEYDINSMVRELESNYE